jgi:hypothetical protein
MKRFQKRPVQLMVLLALALLVAPSAFGMGGPDLGEGQLANVLDNGREIVWELEVPHSAVWLTVSTPCGVFHRVYEKGETPRFSLEELSPDNPDGSYTWQIRIEPIVDKEVAKILEEARQSGDTELPKKLWREGKLPQGPFIQTGEFGVERGEILPPEVEKGGQLRVKTGDSSVAGEVGSELASGSPLDRVTSQFTATGDLFVYNSACIGFDCVNNGETFGADTLRLKENNLRIHIDDTSSLAGFPNQDWRLEFNSNASGGAEYFRVIDATASRNIMTLEANAPSNSLVVDSGGRVGMGTANPVVELHVANGDTPTLRLEQTTASGFGAQVWDVAGNETSFFVRDATGGSTLPFRIFPGNASSRLVVRDDNVGIGTTNPGVRLHVVDTAGAAGGADQMLTLENNGPPRFDQTDTNGGVTFRQTVGLAGATRFYRVLDPSDGQVELELRGNGDLVLAGEIFTAGSCSIGCDRVFSPDFDVETIEEHAASMWANSHLPGVGPTPEGSTINLSQKTTGILNELEKAHIFIEQLHQRIARLEAELEAKE